jgi:hypothetical protein
MAEMKSCYPLEIAHKGVPKIDVSAKIISHMAAGQISGDKPRATKFFRMDSALQLDDPWGT